MYGRLACGGRGRFVARAAGFFGAGLGVVARGILTSILSAH
jgi:hypothetical protein